MAVWQEERPSGRPPKHLGRQYGILAPKDYPMTTTQRELEATAARSRCALCLEEPPRVAYVEGVFQLRCQCWPQAPTLEKRPRSELSKALAEPNYATDALTRMTAERIIAKRSR